MGLREWLRRLERANVPTFAEYSGAAMRQSTRNLASAYRKLAAHGGNPPAGRTGGPKGDTPEGAETDRLAVERWEKAHGKTDMKGAAKEARAKLLGGR